MPKYVDLDKVFDRLEDEWGYDGMRDDLYDLPTADVQEVRYGEWIEGDYGACHCSECGFEYNSRAEVTPYCPQCGTNMDGED